MNNRPPLREGFAPLSTGWSNWFTQVFIGLPWDKGYTQAATLDFPNTLAQAQSGLTVTVAGVRVGDAVQVAPTADVSGIVFTGVVTANNTVTVYAKNFTSAAIDPLPQSFRLFILQI